MPYPYSFPIQFEDARDTRSISPSEYGTVATRYSTSYGSVQNKAGLDTDYQTVMKKSQFPANYEED